MSWARHWNFGESRVGTHDFVESAWERAPKEIGCALAASFVVSPLVGIIDKCMVQDISGTDKFLRAMAQATREMMVSPRVFFGSLPFRLTFGVYFGTYAVANLAELALDEKNIRDDETRKTRKVAVASAANIALLAWRDSVFAREFGMGTFVQQKTPLRTVTLFALRDSATMYATFYLAPRAAKYLEKEHGVERNTAELSMALGIPMVTQFVTAPLHIHAMDYFNNQASSLSGRMGIVQAEYLTVSLARGVRILPAFGLGSFTNNKFRQLFIRQTDEELYIRRRITRMVEFGQEEMQDGAIKMRRRISEGLGLPPPQSRR